MLVSYQLEKNLSISIETQQCNVTICNNPVKISYDVYLIKYSKNTNTLLRLKLTLFNFNVFHFSLFLYLQS